MIAAKNANAARVLHPAAFGGLLSRMVSREQRVVLFQSQSAGTFLNKRKDNLDEINGLLADGWRVVAISPTSSPAASPDGGVFALIVMERDVLANVSPSTS